MLHRRTARSAYTLLEVLLSMAIGVLLLSALYVAINVQIEYTQAAREVVDQSTLARSVLNRMASDITPSLGPPPATNTDPITGLVNLIGVILGGDSSSSSTTSTSSTQGSSTSSTSGTSSSSSSSSSSSTPATTSQNGPVTLVGVQGDDSHLTIYVTRVPRFSAAASEGMDEAATPPAISDLRKLSYWLAGGGDEPLGLARQELENITSEEALDASALGVENEEKYVIADEVKSLMFSYFDGSSWQDSWDSTTAKGPPLAIAITVGIAPPQIPGAQNQDRSLKYFRHVIAIPTANGISAEPQPATDSSTTDGTTTSSSSSSTTSTTRTP